MNITAIALLTKESSLWKDYTPKILEWCNEFLAFEYGGCQESAQFVREGGGLIVDEPIDYLGTSDTGMGLSTLHAEAIDRGADAVFMADPTEVWEGELDFTKALLANHEVIKSKMFRARVTSEDEDSNVFDHKWFEPEYNHKVMFAKAKRGRVYWGMYPFWPYGALSQTEYGVTKSYALVHSREAYRILTMGTAKPDEHVSEVEKRAEDWIAHNKESHQGNPLITEDEFFTKGLELAEA